MIINLSVFKDEDKKDAVTYQSWHWDIMVYIIKLGAKIAPSSPCHLFPTGLPGGVAKELRHQYHLGWHDCCAG